MSGGINCGIRGCGSAFRDTISKIISYNRPKWDDGLLDPHNRMGWLNDEHQQLLAEVPIQDIWERLPEPQEFNIWV